MGGGGIAQAEQRCADCSSLARGLGWGLGGGWAGAGWGAVRKQLAETLNGYVASYDKYKAYTDAVKAGETPEGEVVELPDLRLGKTILECCKSCAEQVEASAMYPDAAVY